MVSQRMVSQRVCESVCIPMYYHEKVGYKMDDRE